MSPLGAGDFPFIIPLLRDKESFLFLTHVNPDGDAIGSSLALALALRRLRKKVTLVRVDELPETYRFLPGADLYVPYQQVDGEYDVALILDCGDLDRVGAARPVVDRAKVKVNIDHHVTNTYYGDYNYIDPLVSSVGEQIFQMLHAAEIALDKDIATNLYVAVATDTGSFRYENTKVDTHMIAASLLMEGVEPGEISNQIYETRSLAAVRLLGAALATLQLSQDGQVGWMTVTRHILEETGATDEDTEGLVNYARSIRGVEVGILFREVEDGQVRMNFRSKSRVDVSAVAARFGGGGHPRAAGATASGTLEEVTGQVLAAVTEALQQAQ